MSGHDENAGQPGRQFVQIDSARLRAVQTICLALAAGVLLFGGILLGTNAVETSLSAASALAYVFAAIPLASVAVALVVPEVAASSALTGLEQRSEAERRDALLNAFQTRTIVRYAVLESGAFVGLFGALLTRHVLPVVAAAVPLLLMFLLFPTEASANRWLRDKQELQQLGP